jgi:hypothetical protein
MEQIRDELKRHEMILHVLPRGKVSLAGSEFVGGAGHLAHLSRGENAARNLGSNHLHAGLALTVHSAPQTPGTKFVLGKFSGKEFFRLRPEFFYVLVDDPVIFDRGLGLF